MKKFISAIRKMRNNPGVEVVIIWSPRMKRYFTISRKALEDILNNKNDMYIPFDETGDQIIYQNF